ncbi:MAG: magnesium transporter [Nitrospiria bacterium]
MAHETNIRLWETLKNLIEKNDAKQLVDFLDRLSPAETARVVSRLDEDNRKRLLVLLSPEDAADILHDLPDVQAADMIEEIAPEEAAAIIDRMPGDEQADILGDVESSNLEAILDAMPQKEAEKTRQLLEYPEETAGAIMVTEYLVYPESMTAGQVLEDIEHHREQVSDFVVQYVYIVSAEGILQGVLRMRDFLLVKRSERISDIMIADPVYVRVNTPLQDLNQLFQEHAYLGVPVTDEAGCLMGVVTREAVMEAAGRQTEDSFLKISGIVGGEEYRSMPMVDRSLRRLSWLSINIVLNIIAASVIAFYQETLSAVIALAVFLPIISDMSGCSGNQAVAVSLRELTLGLVEPHEAMRVFLKEVWVGLMNGFFLGILLGAVAFLWKGNAYLGLVVGGALALNTIVAVCLGGLVPLFLRWGRLDPALASGPILTTLTDMCGFFIALSFASAALPRLS